MRKIEHPFQVGDTLVLSPIGCEMRQSGHGKWLGEGPWVVSETILLPDRPLHSDTCIDLYCAGECNYHRTGSAPGVRLKGFGNRPITARKFVKASEIKDPNAELQT